MKIVHLTGFLVSFICFGYSLDKVGPIVINNLRVEYLKNPLGIDVATPRLSWELNSSENGKRQTAYQIFVASDSNKLLQDEPDLWNSKKVISSNTNQIVYFGATLSSRSYCYWKMRIWDEKGQISSWSPIAHWSVGLLKSSDWKSKWIGGEPENIPKNQQYQPSRGYQSGLSKSQDSPKWVIVDLGKVMEVDEVHLYPSRASGNDREAYLFPKRFRIDVSDDASFKNYKSIADESKSDYQQSGLNTYIKKINAVKTRFVRLWVSRLSKVDSVQYSFALAELEVLRNGMVVSLKKPVKALDVVIDKSWVGENWKPERLVDGFLKANEEHKSYSIQVPPSPLLRKEFTITKKIKRALLYITSLGLYEVHLNGKKVGNQILAPEWTDYHTGVQYQTYDVTYLLKQGSNAIGAMLADGWYAGAIFSHPDRGSYGFDRKLLGALEIQFEDRTTERIITDEKWKIMDDGPIRNASIYDGETYDSNFDQKGWDQPGFNDSKWKQVTVYPYPDIAIHAQMNEPIQVVHELKPVSVFEVKKGVYIFDMGQNIAGWIELNLPYNPDGEIVLRYGEVLDEDSTLYTANLRGAKQIDTYIARKGERVQYEPRFTYHGFRYVEISGLTKSPDLNNVTGKVIASASPITGNFETSEVNINKLWQNILWTQRGNMYSVPTDCPQRDERAGWMGDAQVFSQTAIFNMDMAAFFTKWVRDIRNTQAADGRFPDYSPQVGDWTAFYNSPGWADAGVIVPWKLYLNYGDTAILSKQFPAMKKFIHSILASNPDLIWNQSRGNMYGDWLNGNTIIADDYPKTGGSVPNDVYSTAFFAYSTDILAKTALVLGKMSDARYYDSLATAIRQVFIKEFISSDGKIKGDTQAGYALALDFGLVPEAIKTEAAAHMAKAVEKYDYRISTGIQTTIRLMNQLSNYGYSDIAYKLLESHRFPSWLYSIDQGATTVWERWDGYVKGRGFQDIGMNSFNHYAIGAVGEWMYRNLLGINNDPEVPGYRNFIIKPEPGGSITWAKGSYHSITGNIAVSWKKLNGIFTLEIDVPVNTTANVYVPLLSNNVVGKEKQEMEIEKGAKFLRIENQSAVYLVQSGKYTFKRSYLTKK